MIRNIVVIVVDALRYDCLSCVQPSPFIRKFNLTRRIHTPHLDRFAKDGVLFTRAYTTAPETPPAHASLFTGLYPRQTTIRTFFDGVLPTQAETVFELAARGGYVTFALGEAMVFHKLMRLARGAQFSFDQSREDEAFFTQLGAHSDLPRLAFIRFADTHWPYLVPDSVPPLPGYMEQSWEEIHRLGLVLGSDFGQQDLADHMDDVEAHRIRWYRIHDVLKQRPGAIPILLDLYVRGICQFDAGRFEYFVTRLEQVGMLQNCLWVILADHGEAITPAYPGAVPQFEHGAAAIDEVLRIPLIFYAPGKLPTGCIVDAQVSIVDVLPTILELAGLASSGAGSPIQGTSLVPVFEGTRTSGSPAYSEHWWWYRGQFDIAHWPESRSQYLQSGKLPPVDPVLHQRTLVKDGFRYTERGQSLTPADRSDNEHFVRALYRKLLATWEDNTESSRLVKALESGETTQAQLEKQFAGMAYLNNRSALYDLERDPFEEANLLLLSPALYAPVAEPMRGVITSIAGLLDETTPYQEQTQDLSSWEEAELVERLRLLGYID